MNIGTPIGLEVGALRESFPAILTCISELWELSLSQEESERSRTTDEFPKIKGVETPVIESFTTRTSWFVYVIRFDKKINRDEMAKKLEARGIPVRPYFLPIHLQPYMVEKFGGCEGDFPITEDLGKRGLAIPFSGVMTEEQVTYVCKIIREEVGK